MNKRLENFIKPMIVVAALIFAICCLIEKPETFDDYSSYVGYAISGVCFFFVIYERYLWRLIPWNRPPILSKHYDGTLKYVYKNKPGTKPIKITIKQTWLTIKITTKTDINESYTITGIITTENDVDILYYTYVTNPSAVYQSKNPIQHGTCRMILNKDNTSITGKYWTSSQTIGDMEWNAKSK